MGGRPGQPPITPPPPPPPPKPFNPNDALIADAGGQPIAAQPDPQPIEAAPFDLNSQVQQFLAQQLSGGMTGQDTMTQSALAEYDVGAERARKQQIEDLQRFGVLGGSGVSSGAVADIMGEFDVGTQRGRAGIRSQGMNRILQSILPQATGMAQQQAALAQQQTQFGERQALAEAGATGLFDEEETLAAKQLRQQEELTKAGLTGKYGEEQTLAAQQLEQERELAEAGITGVYGEDDKETLAARQLAQQRELAAGQLTGKFEDSETLAAQQLAQQEEQFQSAQDLAREQATGKIRTGTGGMGQPIIQQTVQAQQLEQRGELERERLAQQAGQFRQQQLGEIDIGGPGFPVVRKTLQAQQLEEATLDAADRRRLAEAGITGKLDDEETLAAQQLGQQESQFQLAQDLAREQATGDISTGRVGYMGEPVTTKSLQSQQLDEQEARRLQQESQFQSAQDLARQQAIGEIETVGPTGFPTPRKTIQAQQLAAQEEGRRQQQTQFESTQDLARQQAIGEITGPMGHPRQTIQAQQLAQQATQDAARLAQQQSQFEAGQDLTREQAIGDIAITGPTGHPTTTRSLQAQQLADQQELARAGLTGKLGEQDTLAAQQLELRRGEALGEITGPMGHPQQTLQAQQLTQQRELAEAGLTGKLGEEDTLAAQQLAQQQTQFDEAQALRRGEALGEIETVGPTGFPTTRQTLSAQQLAQQQQQHTDQQALAEAGVTGQYKDQDTLAAEVARAQDARQEEQFRERDPITMALAASQAQQAGADIGGFSSMNLGSQLNQLLNFEQEAKAPGSVTLTPAQLADMARFGPGHGGQPTGDIGYTQEYEHTAEQLGDWGMNAQQAQDSANTFLSLTDHRGEDLNHWSKHNSGESNTISRDPLDEETKKNFVKQHGPPISTKATVNGHEVTFADKTKITFSRQEEW